MSANIHLWPRAPDIHLALSELVSGLNSADFFKHKMLSFSLTLFIFRYCFSLLLDSKYLNFY